MSHAKYAFGLSVRLKIKFSVKAYTDFSHGIIPKFNSLRYSRKSLSMKLAYLWLNMSENQNCITTSVNCL
jgi:hypothetical protein